MAKLNLLALLILPLLLAVAASDSDSAVPPSDAELRTLLTIKRELGNPAALSSWKTKTNSGNGNHSHSTHCQWPGVACKNGQVTALSLKNLHIAHAIPASICSLKNLSYIDLSYNNLTGEFPATLYGCAAMRFLDLSNNDFSGVLPTNINELSPGTMQHLNLSSNGFSGSLPSAIAGFLKLKSLVLDTNSFNGTYPGAAIGSYLTELETLTLASNPFSPGPIPEEFSKLTKLKYLWLSEMNLTGVIPDSLSALTELKVLALYVNRLHGEIPPWIWRLQKLQYLYLYANYFVGGIGLDITAVSMVELDLSANLLTRPIPDTIGNMKNLTLLSLFFNSITGPIPTSVGHLPNLYDLRLFDNRLSGPLPPELGKHSPLGNLEVSNNLLSGELPDTLCFNKKLYDIVVFNNNFSGAFPASLGECVTLDNIMAYNNSFSGEFPEAVWFAFPKLTTVMIQNNSFTGVLPTELSSRITRIEIGNNRFSGAIPESAAGLRVFAAENNWFSHGLPVDMTKAKLGNLTQLSLAGNQVSGSIPPSIAVLDMLVSLDLNSNQITGAIPAAVGHLSRLLYLDLSNNKLVGSIPEDLGNLRLSSLNLSSNQLAGVVPTTLQSAAFNDSFLDNPGLCVGSHSAGLPLPTCSGGGGGGRSSTSTKKIILSAVSSIALVVFVAVGCCFFVFVRRRKRAQQDVSSWKMIPFRALDFTEHDILSNISEENVVGRGGSGKVHRVHLGSRNRKAGQSGDHRSYSTVAVKKIGNAGKPDTNLDKEFEAEVRSLGGLRHGNIIDLLCCISGEDTKLLVYEYMENASLDRWLHRRHNHNHNHKLAGAGASGPLDWPTRLSIAVDVARGLSYMHHDFTRPVIHRDVKSSNILLDRSFRAKVADFGLARILAKAGESESSSAVCGTIGYIAPEYVSRAKVSEKVDVYSFGVVLLELATGRGAQDGGTESGSCLAKWASKRHKSGGPCVVDMVDSEIQEQRYLEDMVAVFDLGVICTGEDPSSRPLMSEVLHRLLHCGRRYRVSTDDDAAKEVCIVVDSKESVNQPMSC